MAQYEFKPIPQMTDRDVARFWRKVKIASRDECWPWTASKFSYGHGCFGIKTQIFKASRIAYYLATGIDPGSFMVLHSCDNPSCCNAAHLTKGTTQQNTVDRVCRGRGAVGLKNGAYTHPDRRPRGEGSGMAKLTNDIVRHIKSRAALGERGAVLAREFGISKSTACRIISGRT